MSVSVDGGHQDVIWFPQPIRTVDEHHLDVAVGRQVKENLYLMSDSDPSDRTTWTGGNTAVWVTETGVALVDTKLAGYGQDMLDLVRSVTDKPVTTIIHTHTHYDHTGSTIEFPDTVEVVAHENTAANMARATCGPVTNCDAFKGDNAKYLPKRTYSDHMSLFSGRDRIDLYYFGRGHTSGDSLVVFPAVRTVHTGDLFQRKTLPFVDVDGSGGSAVEFGQTLTNAVAGLLNIETVIPGHENVPLAWSDFVNYAGFYNDLLRTAQEGMKAGREVDEVASEYRLPDGFRDFTAPPETVRTIMGHIYDNR